ncbi:MAG TPA: TlpA disulfide reductase family protein [Candidatus Acidoferrales bacterium]|nr:TlpA disulfide reductase family protein [Candidatus Acidoferrales bacterium]
MRKVFGGILGLALAGVLGAAGCGHNTVSAGSSAGSSSVGLAEPQVTFKDLQGASVPLVSLKGKVVLVNFWATWCDPCQAEIPTLIGLQQKYGDKGFTLLGVAMDDDGKSVVEPFVQKTEFTVDGQKRTMNYPIVLGDDAIAQKFGGLIGYPISFLISRDGTIQKKYLGMLNAKEMDQQIESLLSSAPAS